MQSQCSHSAVTMQLQCSHSVVTVRFYCSHSAVTVQPQCSQSAVTVQSQCSHNAVLVQFQCSHSAVAMLKLQCDLPIRNNQHVFANTIVVIFGATFTLHVHPPIITCDVIRILHNNLTNGTASNQVWTHALVPPTLATLCRWMCSLHATGSLRIRTDGGCVVVPPSLPLRKYANY